ncbi:MAG: hypothetical protein Q8Q92_01300 [bacterium]|nr:hypothetical protein [bacterium]
MNILNVPDDKLDELEEDLKRVARMAQDELMKFRVARQGRITARSNGGEPEREGNPAETQR